MPADLNNDIELLFCDKSLLVAFKPAGVPSQPDKTGSDDLLSLLARQLKIKPDSLLPVHRLDRPVSGLIVIARTGPVQAALTRQMEEHFMAKTYLAVVCGRPCPTEAILTDYLLKNERLNTSRVIDAALKNGKRAQLQYATIGIAEVDGQPLSLLAIDLETGRHHQIRVQMAHAGWPLWGDTKYNPALKNVGGWHQLALIASELTFQHPVSGQTLTFKLPMPKELPFSFFSTDKSIV